MSTVLLIVIYIIFISLGLPDSFIGSSWPAISQSMSLPEDFQGILTLIISFFTIISSFLTAKLIDAFKPKGVVIISISLTIIGLIGFSYSNSFYLLCLSAIPLGFGAGAIDATLNNYVALNYKAIHLNWLHASWGAGASISPFIVGFFLTDLNGWREGALVLSIIQSCIFLIAIFSIPIWNKCELSLNNREEIKEEKTNIGFFKTFRIKGVIFAIIGFFCYIGIEQITGLWFSSLCVFDLGIGEESASKWAGLFYLGMFVGRAISGLLSLKIKDKNMIRIGEGILILGIVLLSFNFIHILLPLSAMIIGLGCAPIYPGIIHSTPTRFSKKYSQNVMSVQVGCAYIANITLAPFFGIFGRRVSFLYMPLFLMILLILLVSSNEIVLIKTKYKILS